MTKMIGLLTAPKNTSVGTGASSPGSTFSSHTPPAITMSPVANSGTASVTQRSSADTNNAAMRRAPSSTAPPKAK
jgi:hypothetical protein